LFRSAVPKKYFPGGVSQTERAIAAIRYVGDDGRRKLITAVRLVAPALMDDSPP
jgi:hypothetical protein